MALYFKGLLEALRRAAERHPPPEAPGAAVPDREWAGWQHVVELLDVQGDCPVFRARQAVKVALAADQLNLSGQDVDWDALEQQLEGIAAGLTTLSQLPDTEEDLRRQAPPRAIILYEENNKSKKRAGAALRSYCVVLEGQSRCDGEWFTHAELKKHFPDNYREMLSDFASCHKLQASEGRSLDSRIQEEGVAGAAGEPQAAAGEPQAAAAPLQPAKEVEPAPAAPADEQQQQQQQHEEPASNLVSTGRGRGEAPTVSSAGKRAGPAKTPSGAIPGASSVPRAERQPQLLFQDSGPPPSMVLAGIAGPPPAARPSVPAAKAPVPAKRKPGRPPGPRKAAQPQKVRQVIYPEPLGLSHLTASAEPVVRGRVEQRTVNVRPQRVAAAAAGPGAHLEPAPALPQRAVEQARPWPLSATLAGSLYAGDRQPLPPTDQHYAQDWAKASAPAAGLPMGAYGWGPAAAPPQAPAVAPLQQWAGPVPQQQPYQLPPPVPVRTGRLAAYSRPSALHPAPQPVPAMPSAGATLSHLPPADFSAVPELFRRSAEYIYRTTGRLHAAAVLIPQQVQAQPAEGGLEAILRLLPKPRGAPPPQQQQQPQPQQAQLQHQRAAYPTPSPAAPAFPSYAPRLHEQQRIALAPEARATGAPYQPYPPPPLQQQQRVPWAPAPAAAAPAAPQGHHHVAAAPDPASPVAAPAAPAQPAQLAAAEAEGRPSKRPRVAEGPEQRQLSETGATPGHSSAGAGALAAEQPQQELAPHAQQERAPEPQQQQQAQDHQPAPAAAPAAPAAADSWAAAAQPTAVERQGMLFMQRFEDKALSPARPPAAQGGDEFHVQLEQLPAGPQPTSASAAAAAAAAPAGGGGPEWAPMSLDLRTQPDEVQWTAADAAGLLPTQQQQQGAAVPDTQVVKEEDAGGASAGAAQQPEVVVIPDTEEAQAQPLKQEGEGLEQGGEGDTPAGEVNVEGAEDDGYISVEELLQPEPWKTAVIKGAKNRNDGVELWIDWDWGLGYKDVVPSSRLMGKPHCMATLIRFYESKTRQQKSKRQREEAGDAA